jgi:hypothetical protein
MTAYASINFKTKKALKEAVQRGERITVRSLTPMGTNQVIGGTEAVCGPWYPEPHKWYAEVKISDGKITSVK